MTEPITPADAVARRSAPVPGEGVAVDDLQRRSGGASGGSGAYRVGDRRLILRRDPPGWVSASLGELLTTEDHEERPASCLEKRDPRSVGR